MEITNINVKSGIEYMSEIPEIQQLYQNDLPPNSVICKQVTGCGGTSLVLMNDEYYIVAVHLIKMIENKTSQIDMYPNMLGVTHLTTKEQIKNYVTNGGKKIIVTYDSVPKVCEALGPITNKFRLLVDEFHKLIAYMDSFKPSVVIKLLEKSTQFKSVSYLTATPTDINWLPAPMKDLNMVNFIWEEASQPDLVHCYIKEGMVERVLTTMLWHLDNTDDEVYVFYNSRVGVTSLLKKLLKCKPNLSLSDINILFAENKDNTEYFKKYLGSKFCYGQIPNGYNNKRINIISSMGFEGIDYYPNAVEQRLPTSIVVSDPNLRSMRYDISIDLVQILGRFRKHPILKEKVRNKVIYLWNTQRTDYTLDEEQFLAKVLHDRKESIEVIDLSKTNTIAKDAFIQRTKTGADHHILREDDSLLLHPYGIEAQMSAYKTMHSDATVLNNNVIEYKDGKVINTGVVKDTSVIVSKLSSLTPNISTYEIPLLTGNYTKLLGRKVSITRQVQEWEGLCNDCIENKNDKFLYEECLKACETFLQDYPNFNEWLESGVTTSNMKTLGFNKDKIIEEAFKKRTLQHNEDNIDVLLKFEIGTKYTFDEVKNRIQLFYDKLGIGKKAKSTDIKNWYDVHQTSVYNQGKSIQAFKILSKKQ